MPSRAQIYPWPGIRARAIGCGRGGGGRRVSYSFDTAGHRVAAPGAAVDIERPTLLVTGESIIVGFGLAGLVWQPPDQTWRLAALLRFLIPYRSNVAVEQGITRTRDSLRLPYVHVMLDPSWHLVGDLHPDSRGAQAIAIAGWLQSATLTDASRTSVRLKLATVTLPDVGVNTRKVTLALYHKEIGVLVFVLLTLKRARN